MRYMLHIVYAVCYMGHMLRYISYMPHIIQLAEQFSLIKIFAMYSLPRPRQLLLELLLLLQLLLSLLLLLLLLSLLQLILCPRQRPLAVAAAGLLRMLELQSKL